MKQIHNYISISTKTEVEALLNTELDSSVFLFEISGEDRTFKNYEKYTEKIIRIKESEEQKIDIIEAGESCILNLRSLKDQKTFREILRARKVFIDITGMSHSVWAWLLKCSLSRENGETFVLYTEPSQYRYHENPVEGQIFDLSSKIDGIYPLPGFLSIKSFNSKDFIFIPLLGFEGTRLAHIFENIQPQSELTYPVFGIPGFKYYYPFYSYQGNKNILEREGIWKNYKYEQANCPMGIINLIEEFIEENPEKLIRIALIGTKPHALGAILLKLIYPEKIDLIYDHPVRSKNRTKGKENTILYNLSIFKKLIKVD